MVRIMNQIPKEVLIDKLKSLGVKLCFVYDQDLRPIKVMGIPEDPGYMGIGFFKKNSEYSSIVWIFKEDSYSYSISGINDKFIREYFIPMRGEKLRKLSDILERGVD